MNNHGCIVGTARFAAFGTAFAMIAGGLSADSTEIPASADIEKNGSGSILGVAVDGKTCKYRSSDKKVHCVSEDGQSEIFLAETITSPTFSGVGNLDFGTVGVSQAKRYAFLGAETGSSVSGTDAVVYCKLALQFITTRNEIIWIWHDELYVRGGQQIAVMDTDGSGQPDLAVSGNWNGSMYGSNRWWTPGASSSTYTAAERKYSARPVFGKINRKGRNRGCRPSSARVATLKPLSSNIDTTAGSAVPIWRTLTRP